MGVEEGQELSEQHPAQCLALVSALSLSLLEALTPKKRKQIKQVLPLVREGDAGNGMRGTVKCSDSVALSWCINGQNFARVSSRWPCSQETEERRALHGFPHISCILLAETRGSTIFFVSPPKPGAPGFFTPRRFCSLCLEISGEGGF